MKMPTSSPNRTTKSRDKAATIIVAIRKFGRQRIPSASLIISKKIRINIKGRNKSSTIKLMGSKMMGAMNRWIRKWTQALWIGQRSSCPQALQNPLSSLLHSLHPIQLLLKMFKAIDQDLKTWAKLAVKTLRISRCKTIRTRGMFTSQNMAMKLTEYMVIKIINRMLITMTGTVDNNMDITRTTRILTKWIIQTMATIISSNTTNTNSIISILAINLINIMMTNTLITTSNTPNTTKCSINSTISNTNTIILQMGSNKSIMVIIKLMMMALISIKSIIIKLISSLQTQTISMGVKKQSDEIELKVNLLSSINPEHFIKKEEFF